MLKKELGKLTNDEKLIIIYWKIIECPRQLSVDEISKCLKYPPEYIQNAIRKFKHNVRIRLELDQLKKLIVIAFQNYHDS